jgi:pimeloyl-ACP methyl ester carboxylesterase
MPIAVVRGLRLRYQTRGDVGPGLVFMHGYGGNLRRWSGQVEAFAPRHRTLALEHWGHGRSRPPATDAGYDVERVAGDLLALATRLGLARFHLVGHSLGGAVAQEVALAAPDRVRSLTLADTTDWFGDHGPFDERHAAGLTAAQRRVAVATWGALLRWRGSAGRARTIAAPTLVVHGDREAPKILEGSERLARAIPRAHHAVIRGAGHDPHREQPARFNATLARFLAQAERG